MANEVTASMSIKRGDTFSLTNTVTDPNNGNAVVDITGWTIRSQIRRGKNLTQELTVTITDAVNGVFTLVAPAVDTAGWKVDTHTCDIQVTRPSGVTSSETFNVVVCEDVTYDHP
jgi:hypothetical protein